MNTNHNDGGPVNPIIASTRKIGDDECEFITSYPGMSLRDYYAGQAMTSILLAALQGNLVRASDPSIPLGLEDYAKAAWENADAMLAARGTNTNNEQAEPEKQSNPEIIEAHGLEWYLAGPRSKPPVPGDCLVDTLFGDNSVVKNRAVDTWAWGYSSKPVGAYVIKAWRPTDAPAKLPSKITT